MKSIFLLSLCAAFFGHALGLEEVAGTSRRMAGPSDPAQVELIETHYRHAC